MSTVEVNGTKFKLNQTLEVVEEYSVGMPVRILVKNYSDYSAYSGVIVSIDSFKNKPAVNVLYLKTDYSDTSIHIKTISEHDKDTEIAPMTEMDTLLSRDMIIHHLDEKINKAMLEVATLTAKKQKITTVLDRIFN